MYIYYVQSDARTKEDGCPIKWILTSAVPGGDALINGPDYDPYKDVIFPGMDPHIMIVMRYF